METQGLKVRLKKAGVLQSKFLGLVNLSWSGTIRLSAPPTVTQQVTAPGKAQFRGCQVFLL